MGVLDEIVSHKRAEVAGRRAARPVSGLESDSRALPPAKDFEGALRPAAGARVTLIAEVKRASPSRGVFSEVTDAVGLASTYASRARSWLRRQASVRQVGWTCGATRRTLRTSMVPPSAPSTGSSAIHAPHRGNGRRHTVPGRRRATPIPL